jgi:hypothetical protein
LHRRDTVIGKLQSVVRKELHLLIPEKQHKSLRDIAHHFDVSEVPTADEIVIAQDFQVELVDDKHHPDSRAPVARGAQSTFELQFMTSNLARVSLSWRAKTGPNTIPPRDGVVKDRFYEL